MPVDDKLKAIGAVMKFLTLVITVAISVSSMTAMSNEDKTSAKAHMNRLSVYESNIRKVKSELHLRNKQVETSTKQIKQLNNMYSGLMSQYRQLANQVQYLKYQNDQLIGALKKADSYTPELAKKVKKYEGRMPASVQPKK